MLYDNFEAYMNIVEILKETMKENYLNQSQFALKIGVKQSQVSEWLKGKSKPGYNNLKSICLNIGVSGDFLLGVKEL